MKSTLLKYAVSVVPDTVCVNVPPPSLPLITIWYSSIGLLPGSPDCHVTVIESVVPLGSGTCHAATTLVGAEGRTVAGEVITLTGAEGGLEPAIVALTTVI